MWKGRRIVLGVTGGVAAYKGVLLARELTLQGAHVDVAMSRGAQEFVGAVTFEAVTRRPVHSSLWERDRALAHLALGADADLVLVAPATASFIARAAAGIADDLLTTLVLATTAPVLAAPAMNDEMFANPATTSNLATLARRGWHVVGPEVGALAEGPSTRPGRMSEPAKIIAHAARVIAPRSALTGLRFVVTAGPTRESIDPVRVITNRSSGKMGYRIAEAAWRRGASVVLIAGRTAEPSPVGVEVIDVESTAEMAAAVAQQMTGADVLVMAAAPADYRPATIRTAKLPRSDGGHALDLVPTDDILLATASHRPADLTAVGFALETGNAIEKGWAKLHRKQLDMIVVNDALQPGAGFDVDTNAVAILDRRGNASQVSLRSKAEVAEAILDAIAAFRE